MILTTLALPGEVNVGHAKVHVFNHYLYDSIWSLLGSIMFSPSTVSIVVYLMMPHSYTGVQGGKPLWAICSN